MPVLNFNKLYLPLLSILLTFELLSRPLYYDVYYDPTTSILPLTTLHEEGSQLYNILCIHGWFDLGGWWWFSIVFVQVALAANIGLSKKRRDVALLLSFILYVSLTLRNTYLSYILDRYFTVFLFLTWLVEFASSSSKTLKTLNENTGGSRPDPTKVSTRTLLLNLASVLMKLSAKFVAQALFILQILYLYYDAGQGKYYDPNNGWGFTPAEGTIPALDTYARHTTFAQILYTLLGPGGLRWMTPIVLYTELIIPFLTIGAWLLNWRRVCNVGVMTMISLHVGIGLSMRNAGSLSAVAAAVWLPFLMISPAKKNLQLRGRSSTWRSLVVILAAMFFVTGSYYTSYVMPPSVCLSSQTSGKSPLTSIFHNRWNVFTGSETHVTWEIAPGMYNDGRVRDIWSQTDSVSWELPVGGASSTTTVRGGRWRSFPYLIYYDEEIERNANPEKLQRAKEELWNYLCRENKNLERFKFYMLQAKTLENMTFGETTKRLVVDWTCTKSKE